MEIIYIPVTRSSNRTLNCVDRTFRDKSDQIRAKLGQRQAKNTIAHPPINSEEFKYRDKNYVGSFHKGLQHDENGLLIAISEYEKMRNSIIYNDQQKLASVRLATGAVGKLVNPLAANSSVLVGIQQSSIKDQYIPELSSLAGATEMIELYSQNISRDVNFETYESNSIIQSILDENHMNKSNVRSNFVYPPSNQPFTPKTLFRGISSEEHVGPYISQFLYLDVPMGATILKQKYVTPKPVSAATSRVEWGVSRSELAIIQNTDLNNPGLPGPTDVSCLDHVYIHSGRSLAEAVHSDPAYQFFYQTSLILASLGVKQNPGFPVYPNQSPFITGGGGPNVQCCIAEVTGLALKHSWFWKWTVSRRERPEAQSILVDMIKNDPDLNSNYGLSDILLSNAILNDIQDYNGGDPYNKPNSYTLSSTYREGSPLHPAWPSGHATIAGAAVTVLKIFFDGSTRWKSLNSVINGKLSTGISGPVEANPDDGYNSIRSYNNADSDDMTVNGELNKLATNVGIGRNWAGIHYRSDAIGGMLLGEQIAIKYMEDMLSVSVENNLNGTVPEISIQKFDGSTYKLIATVCRK